MTLSDKIRQSMVTKKEILNEIEPILFPITNEDWYITSGRDSLVFRIKELIKKGSYKTDGN